MKRPFRPRWLFAITLGSLVLAAVLTTQTAALSSGTGVVFSYTGATYTMRYEFLPQTGTLHDLRVVYNDTLTVLPSNFGGIVVFELAGEILRPWEERHTSQLLEETNVGGIYTAHFRWSYNNDFLDFLLRLRLNNQTLVIDIQPVLLV